VRPWLAVRRGVTRTVLLVGPWAIKVPSLCSHNTGIRGVAWSLARGLSANLSEAEWSGQPGLCPVRWSLAGIVNVYPRCEPASEELTEDVYEAVGFPYTGPMDKKPANLGWLNGKLVWVDYDMNWNDRPPCQHRGGERA